MIREMSKEDIKQVTDLEEKCFTSPWTKDAILKSLQKAENVYIVAEVDNKIVGYCGMWGVVGEGQINNVAISPTYRKKGIAYQMLLYAIEKAKEKNIKTFTLEVRKSNETAQKLYKKLGFSCAGIRKNFYQTPMEDAIIMWKI